MSLAVEPKQLPRGDQPLGPGAREFDLSKESAEERIEYRKTSGPAIATFAALGVAFAIASAYFLYLERGVAIDALAATGLLIGSLAVAGFCIYAFLRLGGRTAVRLRVDESGITFVRANGREERRQWNDPRLKVDVSSYSGRPEDVFSKTDAKFHHPFWVSAWSPNGRYVALETTIPNDALRAIVDQARASQVSAQMVRVAFFWHDVRREPGYLDMEEEGAMTAGHQLNGEITRIRGAERIRDGG